MVSASAAANLGILAQPALQFPFDPKKCNPKKKIKKVTNEDLLKLEEVEDNEEEEEMVRGISFTPLDF